MTRLSAIAVQKQPNRLLLYRRFALELAEIRRLVVRINDDLFHL